MQILSEIIYSIISNQKLLRILSKLEKPFQPQLSIKSYSSTYILGSSQNSLYKQAKTWLKGPLFFFTEALLIPNSRKFSLMQNKV